MSMPSSLSWLIAAGLIAFYLFTIYTVLRTQFRSSSEKGIWLVIVIIAPLLGTLIFWAFRPRN